MRKKPLIPAIFTLLSVLLFFSSQALPQTTPAVGDMFPDLKLPLPQKMEERKYLRIEQGPFKLSQIDAPVLIVQIFSMYCPHCQKEAPNVNALFQAISRKPEWKSKIKLLGLGAGNSAFEVNAFRRLYKIEFPLLPDADLSIHKRLGSVGTPYFFVLKNSPPRKLEVIYSEVGSFGQPEEFLAKIMDRAGFSKKK
ncbi:MAG: TlpA disulfide reductase family protein [Syntrophobacteraceae bacterium]